MAEKNRKSNRHFNVEKPVSRHFDIEKENDGSVDTIPVQGSKSDVQNVKSKQGGQQKTDPSKPRYGSWIWVMLLIIAAIVAFFCFKNCGDKEDSRNEECIGNPTTEHIGSAQNNEATEDSVSHVGDAVVNTGFDEMDLSANAPGDPEVASNSDVKVESAMQPSKNAALVIPTKRENNSRAMPIPEPIPSAQVSGDLEENALRVIRGDFGNGQARMNALGDRYSEVQRKVNEIYRQNGW